VPQAILALARLVLRRPTRSNKRQTRRIMETARQRSTEGADWTQTAFQHLLDITSTAVRQTQQVGTGRKRGHNWRLWHQNLVLARILHPRGISPATGPFSRSSTDQ
jgi:hypothetical protein